MIALGIQSRQSEVEGRCPELWLGSGEEFRELKRSTEFLQLLSQETGIMQNMDWVTYVRRYT